MPPSLHSCDGRVFIALSGFWWMKQFLGRGLAKIIFSPQIKKSHLFYDCFIGPTISCVFSGHSSCSLSLSIAAGLQHDVLACSLVLYLADYMWITEVKEGGHFYILELYWGLCLSFFDPNSCLLACELVYSW